MTLRLFFLGIILQHAHVVASEAPVGVRDAGQSETYKIGLMVKSIQSALINPEETSSLNTIIKYGTDSRYYVMIRGWLVQELAGAQSQLDAARDPGVRAQLRQRVEFLKQAIRGIDLE